LAQDQTWRACLEDFGKVCSLVATRWCRLE
jgi:hypothetical protein